MEDLALGRTFQPLVLLICGYMNRLAPVPSLVSVFGGVQGATLRAFSGNVGLTSRNASQRSALQNEVTQIG
jgi:hypothetical protein